MRSFSAARASSAAMLIEMDRIWWRFRREIDAYMGHAEGQIKAFSTAFDALADYYGCSSGFSEVLTAYDGALAARETAHESCRTRGERVATFWGSLLLSLS